MDNLIYIVFAGFGLFVLYRFYKRHVFAKRTVLIDAYQFPHSIPEKIIEKYPHLTSDQTHEVMDGLREYFHVCNEAGKRMVSMPSQVVDVAWHEFILFTRKYENFCHTALGRFLHHTPAEAMKSQTIAQDGIKRAWKISCKREEIESKSPSRLPLLFVLDSKLSIPDGFTYKLDCKKPGGDDAYCAGHIGCGGCGSCGGDSGCGGGCGGD